MLTLLKCFYRCLYTVMILPELETFNFLCSVAFFLHPECVIRRQLINSDLISMLLVFVLVFASSCTVVA